MLEAGTILGTEIQLFYFPRRLSPPTALNITVAQNFRCLLAIVHPSELLHACIDYKETCSHIMKLESKCSAYIRGIAYMARLTLASDYETYNLLVIVAGLFFRISSISFMISSVSLGIYSSDLTLL